MRDEGKVITVNGPVEPDQLGITLMHEHLLFTCLMWFLEESHRGLGSDAYMPVTAQNAALLREFPYHNRDNLINTDWYLTAMEVRRFKMALGRTVVDSSNLGLGRDVWGLRKIADDVGVNIISGTGYYVHHAQPWYVESMTEHEMAEGMIRDITEGADGTEIRCGLIGEIGTSDPIAPSEWKALRAAAITQHATGAAIQIHALHEQRLMPDILDLLIKEMGVPPSRVIAGHMDLTTGDRSYMKRVAEYGTFFELDGFGHPCPTEGVYVSDGDRVGAVEWMISEGHEDQLLFSHDIGLKARLSSFGGPGYDHIMNVIIPMMSRDGVPRDIINKILIDNPRRALTITAESPA